MKPAVSHRRELTTRPNPGAQIQVGNCGRPPVPRSTARRTAGLLRGEYQHQAGWRGIGSRCPLRRARHAHHPELHSRTKPRSPGDSLCLLSAQRDTECDIDFDPDRRHGKRATNVPLGLRGTSGAKPRSDQHPSHVGRPGGGDNRGCPGGRGTITSPSIRIWTAEPQTKKQGCHRRIPRVVTLAREVLPICQLDAFSFLSACLA
jgi:hypothetical protein